MEAEKSSAYKLVIDTMEAVNEKRTYDTIGTPERDVLDKLVIELDELSYLIISEDISNLVTTINVKLDELKALNEKILASYTHLKNISDHVNKISKVVGVLAKVIAKAGSGGLI